MAFPQRALNLSLAPMRRLNSAWGRLTTLRKASVVGIAVMTAVAAFKNAFDVFAMLALPCAMLLLLIWGLSRIFGLLGFSEWSGNIRVAMALAVVVGFFLCCSFMAIPPPRVRHAELNAAMQEVRIQRNKVRIGMTINDVLLVVDGINIEADAESVWLSVLPDNKRFYYSPDSLSLVQHDDGTFTFRCHCGTEPVSRNSRLSESQAATLMMRPWVEPEQVLQNLSASQAAELMKQKMSGGYEWHWTFLYVKHRLLPSFTVTFGPNGRVKDVTDIKIGDLSSHRA